MPTDTQLALNVLGSLANFIAALMFSWATFRLKDDGSDRDFGGASELHFLSAASPCNS